MPIKLASLLQLEQASERTNSDGTNSVSPRLGLQEAGQQMSIIRFESPQMPDTHRCTQVRRGAESKRSILRATSESGSEQLATATGVAWQPSNRLCLVFSCRGEDHSSLYATAPSKTGSPEKSQKFPRALWERPTEWLEREPSL